ncbi:hypothetical protein FK530_18985 [Tsukamurella conjunctivitidis]|uniref:Uncharacterized protein n=1 Tax=Tsukamurella conjunctivitidis TaxID=2592068 RepID=A0A5C5RY35_9ACTN|nr:hypothetical protein [Tsukamurella conjunctivitidis]TWS27408.1 hypothetical protein FK530_18985 [Tsukamurella conjunctivitidis]
MTAITRKDNAIYDSNGRLLRTGHHAIRNQYWPILRSIVAAGGIPNDADHDAVTVEALALVCKYGPKVPAEITWRGWNATAQQTAVHIVCAKLRVLSWWELQRRYPS